MLECPNCGQVAAHWEAPTLGTPGRFVCTPRSWRFRLDLVRAPYGLSQNDRPKHWAVRSTATKYVRRLVAANIAAEAIPRMGRCRVEVAWVVPDARKRDPDNLTPFTKAIFDAIGSDRGIGAQLVPDDDPAHMDKRMPTIEIRRGEVAHFLITITDTTPRKDGT